ncbi:SAVED domain-containing protein [Halococcus sediminicola]|uniref:SAVED domain-containing protein n=1 Tax=Halococcus sediminicola TaxID=1264579 RepID=UPI00067952A3|nr:SAVED domain-containing protein [Halococcus sediminicola]
MTEITGNVFLSYKHEQKDVATVLQESLEDHGIPVWRDIFDLRPEPLRDEIRDKLTSPDIACGVALISEGVAGSEVILEDELPGLRRRWDAGDGFFIVLVPHPDLSATDAKPILEKASGPINLKSWKMVPLEAATSEAARSISKTVLQERLRQADEELSSDEPIECSLDTRDSPAYSIDPLVVIDWEKHFDVGLPSRSLWEQRLLPSLETTTDFLNEYASGRTLRFRGKSHLCSSFALGYSLPSVRGTSTTWMQPSRYGGFHEYTLSKSKEDSTIKGKFEELDGSDNDLAVLVNVLNDVSNDMENVRNELPDFNAELRLTPEVDSYDDLNAGQAVDIATTFRSEIRKALQKVSDTETIHLFMAVPTGLAFLMGQESNALRQFQTYCHMKDTGEYKQGPLLQSQSYTSKPDQSE